ncbi:MAG: methyltransferase [Bacteroidales bacterium]|nr:methyltransferase [Bacteroidales bacterium]
MNPSKIFRFKQFDVNDSGYAMKVGFDAVLLGAWANPGRADKILDVGTGSGVIALIMAQKNQKAGIVAIDVDESAIRTAEFNFRNSPWNNRLIAKHIAIESYSVNRKRYDLIISNPPFFIDSLKPDKDQASVSKHNKAFDLDNFIYSSAKLLEPNGILSMIYPFSDLQRLLNLAAQNELFITRKTEVITSPGKHPKRVLIEFNKRNIENNETSILEIYDQKQKYSDAYKELTRDFYLNF